MKGIIKFLKNNILLSPIALLIYFFVFVISNLVLFIIKIPVLLVFVLGFLSIFSLKEIITP